MPLVAATRHTVDEPPALGAEPPCRGPPAHRHFQWHGARWSADEPLKLLPFLQYATPFTTGPARRLPRGDRGDVPRGR